MSAVKKERKFERIRKRMETVVSDFESLVRTGDGDPEIKELRDDAAKLLSKVS